jgi:oligopeptide/dipeptide ABC transporter ATP-binding protein
VSDEALLSVEDLHIGFRTPSGVVPVVNGIEFTVQEKQRFAIVGESGSGKSLTARSILGLLPQPHAVASGSVKFRGRELLGLRDRELRRLRGREIAMVFQDAMTSLNPVLSIGRQMTEPLEHHLGMSHRGARRQAIELAEMVQLRDPQRCLKQYPHELSGGMRQRIMIAMALSCKPALLIADEPTTALDVTVQDEIIQLLRDLSEQTDTSIILITHDLAIVAEFAEVVAVLYAGEILELGSALSLFERPRHPYTEDLLHSIPRVDLPPSARLHSIPGQIPLPGAQPTGCIYADRCTIAVDRCRAEKPRLEELDSGRHQAACWFLDRDRRPTREH